MIKWLTRDLDELDAIGRAFLYFYLGVVPLLSSSLTAIRVAWGEHWFVAIFAEQFVATWLALFGTPGEPYSIVLAGLVGMKVWHRTRRKAAAWIAGIAVLLALCEAASAFALAIPGVDWRYQELVDAWLDAGPEDPF